MNAAVPGVEVADDGDALRIRRPDGEVHTAHAAERHRVRAQPVVHFAQRALAEQVQVVIGDDAAEAVRVVEDGFTALLEPHMEAVVDAAFERCELGNLDFEQPVGMLTSHRQPRLVWVPQEQIGGLPRLAEAGARRPARATIDVRSQPLERIGLLPANKCGQVWAQDGHLGILLRIAPSTFESLRVLSTFLETTLRLSKGRRTDWSTMFG